MSALPFKPEEGDKRRKSWVQRSTWVQIEILLPTLRREDQGSMAVASEQSILAELALLAVLWTQRAGP